MKLTIRQVVEARPALLEISQLEADAHLAFRLARVIRLMRPEWEEFDKEQLKLLKEHADKGEGNEWRFRSEEEFNAYNRKINALLDEVVELPFSLFSEEEYSKLVGEKGKTIWLISLLGVVVDEGQR